MKNAVPAPPKHDHDLQRELFSKGLRLSVGAHAAVAMAAILSGLVFSRKTLQYTPSIRVDLVALPDIAKRDLNKFVPDDLAALDKKLSEASRPKPKAAAAEPEPQAEMTLKKQRSDADTPTKAALKKEIERMRALEELEKDVKKSKPSAVAKGNAIAKGDSLTGTEGTDTNRFLGKLQGKLRENWNLPVWLSKQDLDAKVVIFLDRRGFVRQSVFAKSSGNKQFDDTVLKTIRMSQPFDDPPEEVLSGGITLGFPL